MKRTKLFISMVAMTALMSSCVTTTYMITDNAVGSKEGVAKLKFFAKDSEKPFSESKKAPL